MKATDTTVEFAIGVALGWDHLATPPLSVCNMLNLDPKMTIGELHERLGDHTWESTHAQRMVEASVELDRMVAAQAPGSWLTPEYHERRLREVRQRLAGVMRRHRYQ